jgi:hypothetical protein
MRPPPGCGGVLDGVPGTGRAATVWAAAPHRPWRAIPRSAGWVLVGVLMAVLALPQATAAQGGGVVQTTVPGRQVMTPRQRAEYDSAQRAKARRDSAERDSSQKKLVHWVAPDSETDALLQREGYKVTRYQGNTANYNADSHALTLTGVPGEDRAAVNQEQSIVVGDTIVYHDSTRIVDAHGDTITVRDPSRNQDDIISIRTLEYNVASHTALTSNVRTVFPSGGNRWIIAADAGAFQGDTAQRDTVPANTFYGLDGAVTTCDDSFPHYHFSVKELKFVTKHVLVGRPAILYIADVPVMWLPFVVQDLRTGRRSGVLTPQFGISELVRNSPSYRRHVENVGYYFDINDYIDLSTWLDWRSSARATAADPGWTRYSGVFRYRWLDRFVSGSMGLSYETLSNGTTNKAISWQHQQDFSLTSHLNMNVNYETSTAIQQTTYFNPYTVLAVISSQVNFQQAIGPANVSIGGTQKQYPGRSEIDRVFPTLSISSKPVTAGNVFSWTPSFSATNTESLNIDEFGNFAYKYSPGSLGLIDSTAVKRDQRATSANFDTPIKLFNFTWRNSFRLSDQQNNFPEQDIVYVPAVVAGRDTALPTERIFSQTYNTSLDWDTGIDLPSLFQGTWNIVPSVGIQNADAGAAFMIRTQFTGANFETQPKRPLFGLSLSPTFYGLFPGFGDVSRFRHSITPVITFDYAPAAHISNQFFAAAGQDPHGSLAGLQQKSVSLSLSQNIEAKLRVKPDEDPSRAKKVKVLQLTFDPITYDFERAQFTKRSLSGFTNGSWGYSFRSDLLPGFDFRQTYSLFQGDPLSDTAVFKPYWQQLSAAWSLNRNSGFVSALARLLGMAPPVHQPGADTGLAARDPFLAQQIAAGNVVGGATGVVPYTQIPAGQGWQATFTFSAYRQRPPVGNLSNVIQYNPATVCAPYATINPIYYNQCLLAKRNSTPDTNFNATTAAAPFVVVPPTTTLQASTSFNITPKWAAQWQTTYDFRAHNFASHIVSLQRDLHDWRAIFSFTQSPTGSFAFSFFVALKAEPALKFNYDKQTYRAPGSESTGQTY